MKFIPQRIKEVKSNKNKNNLTNTKDRIFPNEILEVKKVRKINKNNYDHLNEIKGKENYVIKRSEIKPCNNDFKTVSDEAKNNLNKRYYFDNQSSLW